MSHDGRAVANFVLDRCEATGRRVSNLALQKIVYFCHVWSLVRTGKPLVKHRFEAWEHGPVLPYLYREFKIFDAAPIDARAKRIDPMDGQLRIVEYDFAPDTMALLTEIVDFYSRIRASDLRGLSHVTGGPWHQVWNHRGSANPGMKIDDAEIQSFYSRVSSPFSIQ